MKVQVDSYGMTDVGRCRENNEDQFFIAELSGSMKVHYTSVSIDDSSTVFGSSQGHLFLVADGLGGHAAGERASALAISAVSAYAVNRLQLLYCAEDQPEVSIELQSIAAECQKRLARSARKNPDEYGMATTLTLAIVIWPQLYVMHVGDSRCYLVRMNEVKQLTRDHTLGQLYSQFGDEFKAGEGANHALWNVVSSQSEADPVADVLQLDLQANDQLVLCTDGLYNHVDDGTIGKTFSSGRSCREACEKLVALANEGGGKDNITVVVSRFTSACQGEEEPTVATRVPLSQVLTVSDSQCSTRDTDEFVIAKEVDIQ